jgi:hypothetical protein
MTVLLERTGLLRRPALDSMDFVHRTFQEFLAGKQLVENDDVGQLVDRATDDQWANVITMAAGHAQPAQLVELIEGLTTHSAYEPGGRLAVLAVSCYQTAARIPPKVQPLLFEAALSLMPPETQEAAEVLAFAGPAVLSHVDVETLDRRQAAAVLRTASILGGAGGLALIAQIARAHEGLQRELSAASVFFAADRFVDDVLAEAKLDGHLIVTDHRLLRLLDRLTNVQMVELRGARAPGLNPLGLAPPAAESLILHDVGELRGVAAWAQIRRLEVRSSGRLPDLSPLSDLGRLMSLTLEFGAGRVVRLAPVGHLPSLGRIAIRGIDDVIVDLQPLERLGAITLVVPADAQILNAQPEVRIERLGVSGRG